MAQKLPRKGFLDLPGELRDNVYSYAKERDGLKWHPHPKYMALPLPVLIHCRDSHSPWPLPLDTARAFFGLTQTCKLIREEYRPLWLNESCARVRTGDLKEFLSTFFPLATPPNGIQITPKLLQVSMIHKPEDQRHLLDLTQIIRLRARQPAFICEIVPHNRLNLEVRLARKIITHNMERCQEYLSAAGIPSRPYRTRNVDARILRPHVNMKDMSAFLGFDNEKWLADVLNDNITGVTCEHIRSGRIPSTKYEIKIHFSLAGYNNCLCTCKQLPTVSNSTRGSDLCSCLSRKLSGGHVSCGNYLFRDLGMAREQWMHLISYLGVVELG
ncbi:hypothetical protein N0V90_009400 [Kalmusia sp. IMI 367209]|nr:hypothetical protein N0V90_009400 [Kalmusia sp. IMI 367209]